MQTMHLTRRCVGRAAALLPLAGLLAACSSGVPAPVVVGQATMPPAQTAMTGPPPVAGPISAAPLPAPRMAALPPAPPPPRIAAAPPSPPPPLRPHEGTAIVVEPGQSVRGLAAKYHVSPRAIIAANHLAPPYGIEIGQRLVIPNAREQPSERLAATPPPHWVQRAGQRPPPEIIPLDGPPPRPPAAAPQRMALAPTAPPPRRAPATTAEAPGRGGLLWPVAGRVVEGDGTTRGAHRKDGSNLAAPRAPPVRAVASGVVAYAGNQLRGYGNLVLIKHPDGLISAYAHCEQLLVHRGEPVTRGQVIAKVGETGGVERPQLHFELREGDRAVDPRRFLGPMQG